MQGEYVLERAQRNGDTSSKFELEGSGPTEKRR